MPIYEYWCFQCNKKIEILFLRMSDERVARCPRCGSQELKRLVSRFCSPKSEEARLEALADPSRLAGLDENDPASMARWVKQMGRELGEEIGGDEIDQMAEEIATGASSQEDTGPIGSETSGPTESGNP